MIPLKVKQDCIGCGQCVLQCPTRCLMIKNSKRVYISSENCSLCGHCFAICPVGAIEIFDQSADQLKLDLSNLNEVENIIAYRRSIRKYEPEPLSPDTINELLQFLKYSPTMQNENQRILLLQRGALDDIGSMIAQEMSAQFPKLPQQQNQLDIVFRGAPHCVVIICKQKKEEDDGIIALTQLELLAQSRGIGTFWAGMLKNQGNASSNIQKRMGLERMMHIAGCIGFGRPAIKYKRSVGRIPFHIDIIE